MVNKRNHVTRSLSAAAAAATTTPLGPLKWPPRPVKILRVGRYCLRAPVSPDKPPIRAARIDVRRGSVEAVRVEEAADGSHGPAAGRFLAKMPGGLFLELWHA